MLPRSRPSPVRAQPFESAYIARDYRACGSDVSLQVPSWSSPSNGSFNCTDFLYGASSQIGLGSRRWIGFSISCSIGQPFARYAAKGAVGAFHVIDSELDPVAVAEIKLREIAMQMLLANVEIAAVDAAFQQREEPLDGVGVGFDAVRQPTRPFFFAVVHGISPANRRPMA